MRCGSARAIVNVFDTVQNAEPPSQPPQGQAPPPGAPGGYPPQQCMKPSRRVCCTDVQNHQTAPPGSCLSVVPRVSPRRHNSTKAAPTRRNSTANMEVRLSSPGRCVVFDLRDCSTAAAVRPTGSSVSATARSAAVFGLGVSVSHFHAWAGIAGGYAPQQQQYGQYAPQQGLNVGGN